MYYLKIIFYLCIFRALFEITATYRPVYATCFYSVLQLRSEMKDTKNGGKIRDTIKYITYKLQI